MASIFNNLINHRGKNISKNRAKYKPNLLYHKQRLNLQERRKPRVFRVRTLLKDVPK